MKKIVDFDSRLLQFRDFSSRLFPRDRRVSRPRPGPSFRDQDQNFKVLNSLHSVQLKRLWFLRTILLSDTFCQKFCVPTV